MDSLRSLLTHTDDNMTTAASVCKVFHWCKYWNPFEKLYWERCGMCSCEAASWAPMCLFLKSLLFSLEEKLVVDFLDSRHDEVSLCRSLMDHFNIYLLILPWCSQLCPSAEVTFLHIPLNSQFSNNLFCPALFPSSSCPHSSDVLLSLTSAEKCWCLWETTCAHKVDALWPCRCSQGPQTIHTNQLVQGKIERHSFNTSIQLIHLSHLPWLEHL